MYMPNDMFDLLGCEEVIPAVQNIHLFRVLSQFLAKGTVDSPKIRARLIPGCNASTNCAGPALLSFFFGTNVLFYPPPLVCSGPITFDSPVLQFRRNRWIPSTRFPHNPRSRF